MTIGILTFHWATNYGAVLQCYALQTFLTSLGHEVKIINYKPKLYNDSLYNFFRYRKFLNLAEYYNNRKKEIELCAFRNEKLDMTERIVSCDKISEAVKHFDIIVSGSDQVANPSFLMHGEGKNVISPTYFLGFPFNGKRIGYALSFGCVKYPAKARKIAANYIRNFDIITVRESSGIEIIKLMGRDDAKIVPDPTLLMDSSFYHEIADESSFRSDTPYIYSFFIRNISARKSIINEKLKGKYIIWNNEDKQYSMQSWLSKIKHADFVITDSFHCMVMCLKFHTPFVVVTEQEGNVGMNDRMYTLLREMNLMTCIQDKNNINTEIKRFDNWQQVDERLMYLMQQGTKNIMEWT